MSTVLKQRNSKAVLNTEIMVKIGQFDGPLALLLYLVQKHEMDLENLNLTDITQQYLTYLNRMRELNFDVAGDFLFMASTLVYLKSNIGLEDPFEKRNEEDSVGLAVRSADELAAKLKELERFQKMGEVLTVMPKLNEESFKRPKPRKKDFYMSFLPHIEVDELTRAMMDNIIRWKRKFNVIYREKLSIKEKLTHWKMKLQKGVTYPFTDLLETEKSLQDIVLSFISLLELSRMGRVSLTQASETGEMYCKIESALDDVNLDETQEVVDPSQIEGSNSETPNTETPNTEATDSESSEVKSTDEPTMVH